ncbi:MAG TPA: acyl-CoA thioesterase, partial [Saprospiraceae bacterium]|nr:acyl-CoA thioesterase [Saprospiraceae bacterium]
MSRHLHTQQFQVRWGDLDPNFHLRGTVYLDYCDHTRMAYFAEQAMPIAEWQKNGYGPVILEQSIQYLKEVTGSASIEVRLFLDRIDREKIIYFNHEILGKNDMVHARAQVVVGILSLNQRKLIEIPNKLLE